MVKAQWEGEEEERKKMKETRFFYYNGYNLITVESIVAS